MTDYRIEKRVANTDSWAVVGRAPNRQAAVEKAKGVEGGKSTGVRIVADEPYAEPEVIIGN